MFLHSRAQLSPAGRALLVRRVREENWSVQAASEAAGVSRQSGYKWLRREWREGPRGLQDRSSRPRRIPRRLDDSWRHLIIELRRCRLSSIQIARKLRLPRSTVSRVVQQAGLSRVKSLELAVAAVRYEWKRPGDLLHLDVKKLGRFWRPGHRVNGERQGTRNLGAGWEFVHVAIDDRSRVVYVEVLGNERGPTTVAFLRRAMAWFKRQGVRVRRILTDNGTNYRSKVFARCCRWHKIRHLRTQPYRPCTNGKAERFIQTLIREWAYAVPFRSSTARRKALPAWVAHYNRERPHGSLNGLPPASRLGGRCEQRP
jgi:transposase InsO family protein